ncbi:lipase family [Brachionus plicatilis]|uniref:Lipase family n=1 Tax=Brachionus plicatilis TaxID=10195 RepID=A0A3M7QSN4_BRAPC|nr:lipase family [Brachionus plicatilis]
MDAAASLKRMDSVAAAIDTSRFERPWTAPSWYSLATVYHTSACFGWYSLNPSLSMFMTRLSVIFLLGVSSFALNIELWRRAIKLINDNFFGDIKWPDNEIVRNYQKQIEEIESKLIKNNESFRMFPNDYVPCFISNKVYEDITENQQFEIHYETWKVFKVFNIPIIDTTDEKNKKITTKKGSIYSAHRGININVYNFNNKNGPLEMNIEGILRNEYIPQLCFCYEITTKKDYNLSFTGYSNGAWLAEYSIYFFKRLLKNDNVKAVLFESPGMLKDEGQFL